MERKSKNKGGRQSSYSTIFQKKVVQETLLNQWSYQQAADHFGLKSRSIISGWVRKHADELDAATIDLVRTDAQNINKDAKDQRIEQLEKALLQAQLKITGLETMIELAEKEFHLDIQKSLAPNSPNHESTLFYC